MEIDEKKTAVLATLLSLFGIALLLLLAETPKKASVAEALVANENTLVDIEGLAANISGEKFSLCDRLCIAVRAPGLPSVKLLSEGKKVAVRGRVNEYMGRRYLVAEKLGME